MINFPPEIKVTTCRTVTQSYYAFTRHGAIRLELRIGMKVREIK